MKCVMLVFISFIIGIGCESSVAPYALTTNISGTVTEMGSGIQLDSTTVIVMAKHKKIDGNYSYHQRESSRTNENGYYEIRVRLDNGIDYYLQVVKTGYHPIYGFSEKIYVRYIEHQTIDVQLSKQ